MTKKPKPALLAGGDAPDNTDKAHAGLQNQYEGRTSIDGFHDSIDPYTGNLTIKMGALTIPGNGGLDMSVGWTYRMEGLFNSGSSSLALDSKAAFSMAGYGVWQLDVAPLVTFSFSDMTSAPYSACDANNSALSFDRSIVLQTADGRADSFFFVSQGIYETKSNWRLICDAASNTQLLLNPNGTRYRLGMKTHHQFPAVGAGRYQDVYQTTRVTDRNGNHYDIAYTPATLQFCFGAKNNGTTIVLLPSKLSASDGRLIKLNYDAGVQNCADNASWRSPRLQSIEGPDGALWQFAYHPRTLKTQQLNYGYSIDHFVGGQLAAVTLPDNTAYQFEYPDECPTVAPAYCHFEPLSKITLPPGGTIGYRYRQFSDLLLEGYSSYPLAGWATPPDEDPDIADSHLQAALFVFASPDVLERSTSDGGVWTYNYDRPITKNVPEGSYDVTTIDGPAGREVHRFYGLGYFTPTTLAANSPVYNVCNPQAYSWLGVYCGLTKPGAWQVGLPVDFAMGDDYLESYVYQPRLLTSADEQLVAGRVRIADAQVFVPDLQSKSIVVHGVSFNTTYTNYDQYGNPRTITESGPRGGNRTTTVSYNNDPVKWILKQVKDESFPGSATTRSFDPNGNLLSVTTDGVTTSHTYDAEGNVETTTFPRKLVHTYSNYKRGIPQTELQPEGVEITRIVSDAGNVTSETNGERHTKTYGFDGLNRIISITYTRGNATTISYSATDKVMTRGDLVETTVYDGFGRPQSITLGGITRSYGYDALGRRTFESNPGSTVGTTFGYDALNRPVSILNADNTSETISYAGIDKTVEDERKNATTYQYRAYGNIRQQFLMGVVAADPAMCINVERNARDLVTDITQGGLTRHYGYNANYYLSSVTNPETGDTIYGRDNAGNMTSRRVGSSGKVIFAYDDRNRVTTATYPRGTPSVSYGYSKTDKIKTVSSAVASRVNHYDENENLDNESVTVDGRQFSTDYAYNGNDQLDSITYPQSRRVVAFRPDVLGRPSQVSGYVSNIGYWPSGQISQIDYVNGTTSLYGQNARLWPSSFSTAKGGTTYMDNSYDYDGVGNLATIRNSVDSSYNRTLGYDAVNRLASIDGPWGAGTILYDGVGNITSQTLGSSSLGYSYDQVNRLGSIFGDRSTQFNYDDYGNVIGALGNSYTYDQVPNLRCVNCGDPSLKTEYSYDGLNRRLVVKKGGEKSYEIYGSHGIQLIEFTPGPTNKLIEYFYLGGKRIAQTITY